MLFRSATVTVERDGLGVPTISGAAREDVARALGFVHAQERFFQMDLQRRQPAGELSALVGPRALDVDADNRLHRFRATAHRAVELAEPSYRQLLQAYADGVNAGVKALGAPPFEYLLLRTTPDPWLPEDSILTVLAMFNNLQGKQAGFEAAIGAVRDTVPEPMFRFLTTVGSEWETPVIGDPVARPPIPGPDVINLRRKATEARRHGESFGSGPRQNVLRASVPPWPIVGEDATIIGSNNWAVEDRKSTRLNSSH